MMFDESRFAVISDIHGNVDALRAVLDDIAAQRIESVINLGDHLSGPMAARETAEVLMARDMPAIRGNHDRWLVEQAPEDMGSIDRVSFGQLETKHLDWLRSLPAALRLTNDIFLCHGTPESDTTYWLEKVTLAGDIVLRPRDEIEREAGDIGASLFLCGHTHLPRRIDLPGGRIVLNPGSVGCPGYVDDHPVHHVVSAGTAAACYATVERRGGLWVTGFRHVPYDAARMVALAEQAGHPNWRKRLATGWTV